jgi:hypothetical protein
MSEHYSKLTVSAECYCRKCNKMTQHNVFDGRRGSCQQCLARLEAEAAKPKPAPPPKQESLL